MTPLYAVHVHGSDGRIRATVYRDSDIAAWIAARHMALPWAHMIGGTLKIDEQARTVRVVPGA